MSTSTKATKKLRSDPEKKYSENRARQLKRILEGHKPRQSTMDTYKISIDEINAQREVIRP